MVFPSVFCIACWGVRPGEYSGKQGEELQVRERLTRSSRLSLFGERPLTTLCERHFGPRSLMRTSWCELDPFLPSRFDFFRDPRMEKRAEEQDVKEVYGGTIQAESNWM